ILTKNVLCLLSYKGTCVVGDIRPRLVILHCHSAGVTSTIGKIRNVVGREPCSIRWKWERVGPNDTTTGNIRAEPRGRNVAVCSDAARRYSLKSSAWFPGHDSAHPGCAATGCALRPDAPRDDTGWRNDRHPR